MNLYIDIGNSRIKWSFSEQGRTASNGSCDYQSHFIDQSLEKIRQQSWAQQPEPVAIYVACVAGESVKNTLDDVCDKIWQLQPRYAHVSEECLGIKNGYSDIQQLGVDRWLAIIAAWHVCNNSVLVVDCGTAITIDAVMKQNDGSTNGVHQGGLIVPGISMMNELLADKTHGINKAETSPDKNIPAFATSTEEGLYAGSIYAITALIEKSHEQFQSLCSDKIQCILTGGAAAVILSELKLEALHEPNLVLSGLELWGQSQ